MSQIKLDDGHHEAARFHVQKVNFIPGPPQGQLGHQQVQPVHRLRHAEGCQSSQGAPGLRPGSAEGPVPAAAAEENVQQQLGVRVAGFELRQPLHKHEQGPISQPCSHGNRHTPAPTRAFRNP